jgi:ATP-dependent DNA helicase RecQ
MTQQEIKETLGLEIGVEGVRTSEQLLEKAGVLERLEPSQNMAVVRITSDLPTLVDLLPRQATTQRKVLRVIENFVGDRRHELVYFRPQQLAVQTGIDAAAFSRGLHELRELKSFEYVPPFRGRAVHMLERNMPFEKLQIDFETLEKRKQQEYAKLQTVVSFARSGRCRQQEILDYFGQENPSACRQCDNCGASRPVALASAPQTDALLQAARMILSGVARMRGRFGRNILAQMMCGSQAAMITKFRLDRLSTYGLLSHLKQPEVVQIIDGLIGAGYLEQVDVDRRRPVVRLTERGDRLMRGHEKLVDALKLPRDLVRKLDGTETSPAPQPSVPARPTVATQGKASAKSSAKVEPKSVVSAAVSSPDTTVDKRPAQRPQESGEKPTHYWTWRMLQAGLTPDECAAARGLERDVVFDHALRAAEEGLAVEASWFLPAEKLAAFNKVIGPQPPPRIRPLLAQLPRGTRYEEVQLFLRCRSNEQGGAGAKERAGSHSHAERGNEE